MQRKIFSITIILFWSFYLSADEAKVDIPSISVPKNGSGSLPINIEYQAPVAGVQIEMAYNTTQVRLEEPVISGKNGHFEVSSNSQNGHLKILVFSFSGKQLDLTNQPLLTIPVHPLPGFKGKVDLSLTELILADPQGKNIQVKKRIGTLEVSENLPQTYQVQPNFPNPFNPVTRIKYQLPEASQVVAVVYNLAGQEVRTLENNYKAAGYYQLKWDGKNNDGQQVASGEYIFNLKANGYQKAMKMLFLK